MTKRNTWACWICVACWAGCGDDAPEGAGGSGGAGASTAATTAATSSGPSSTGSATATVGTAVTSAATTGGPTGGGGDYGEGGDLGLGGDYGEGGDLGFGGEGGGAPLVPPMILSAFWGADDVPGVPPLDCDGFGGLRDGMPIVMSAEVDQTTLQASDIQVVLASGAVRAPACVKLEPADEENEDRTILLIGDLGDDDDAPTEVRIVGSLLLEDGQDAVGSSTSTVVGIAAGPSLVVAERVLVGDEELGGPDDCPESTAAMVRTIWSGGVDGDMGAELDAAQLDSFFVEIDAGDGTTELVSPFAFGDLNDGDNNVDLCLDDARPPLRVRVLADTVTDPTNDWNDETEVAVTPG